MMTWKQQDENLSPGVVDQPLNSHADTPGCIH